MIQYNVGNVMKVSAVGGDQKKLVQAEMNKGVALPIADISGTGTEDGGQALFPSVRKRCNCRVRDMMIFSHLLMRCQEGRKSNRKRKEAKMEISSLPEESTQMKKTMRKKC